MPIINYPAGTLSELTARIAALEVAVAALGTGGGGGGTTYYPFTGASSGSAGSAGLVPAPSAGQENSVLAGSATWLNTTAIGRAILAASDASAARGSLELGSAALASSSSFQPAGSYAGLGANTFAGQQHITDTTQSTNTTSGAVVVAGGLGLAGNLNVGGFTSLGDNVSVKCKRITGTLGNASNPTTLTPHGLDSTKIVGLTVVNKQNTYVGISVGYNGYQNGFAFGVAFNSSYIQIDLSAGNSYYLYDQACEVLVFYVE